MDRSEIEKIFSDAKAIITSGHFVYKSGKHGSAYVNKDAVYAYPEKICRLSLEIAYHFIDDEVDVVIGPAIGGVILSQWVAFHLTSLLKKEDEVLAVYAEKDGDSFVIKRGYDKLLAGKNVLIVEDVVTTGGSVKKVIEILHHDSKIVGLGILCNRGNISFNVPKFKALLTVDLKAWDEKDCPLCAKNVPVNIDLGKGRQFLSHQKQ